jgi:hypothetical protein
VIAVGIACPALRTVDVVFVGWLLGNLAFLAVTFWVFRGLPWKALTDIAVDVQWIRRCPCSKSHLAMKSVCR